MTSTLAAPRQLGDEKGRRLFGGFEADALRHCGG